MFKNPKKMNFKNSLLLIFDIKEDVIRILQEFLLTEQMAQPNDCKNGKCPSQKVAKSKDTDRIIFGHPYIFGIKSSCSSDRTTK